MRNFFRAHYYLFPLRYPSIYWLAYWPSSHAAWAESSLIVAAIAIAGCGWCHAHGRVAMMGTPLAFACALYDGHGFTRLLKSNTLSQLSNIVSSIAQLYA